jgi:hypothetical protein
MISPMQRSLPDKTLHSQQTDTHDAGGIQTRSTSKIAAADSRLRLLGHWDRHWLDMTRVIILLMVLNLRVF